MALAFPGTTLSTLWIVRPLLTHRCADMDRSGAFGGRFVSDEKLTAELARRVMGWKPAPNRFVKSGRSWIPKWRFQPLKRLEDAFAVLEHSRCEYVIERSAKAGFTVQVRIGGRIGTAGGDVKARAISVAVGRALQIDGLDGVKARTAAQEFRKR